MSRFALATLNHSPLHGLPVQWESHLDAAGAAGFDALAPDIFWLRAFEAEGGSLAALGNEIKQRGLTVMEIAGIAIADRDATKEELEENLRYAEALNAEFVNARIVAKLDAQIVDSVVRCADEFSRVGTRVALEFSRGTTLKSVSDTQALVEAAGGKSLGVTLDTWHFCLAASGPDWDALADLPLSAFANVQLSDGVPYSEGAFGKATMDERKLPGEGDFELRRIAGALAEKGFDHAGEGAIVVEVLSAEWRARPLEEFAQAAMKASRGAWIV